jgi:hypothetical protein
MPVLSDADVGITGESAAPGPRGRVLSDADMGIAPPPNVASDVAKSAGLRRLFD